VDTSHRFASHPRKGEGTSHDAQLMQWDQLPTRPILVMKTKIKTKMTPFRFIKTKTKTISFQKKRKRNKNKNDFIKYE